MTWDGVVELAERRGGAYALLATRGDQVLLERYRGCRPDSLFFAFSVTKPFTAMAIHLLAERGQLSLDDPVAHHWPAYVAHGKDAITIRHVLEHRAGVPSSARFLLVDLAAMPFRGVSVWLAQRARPRWPAGQEAAYHVVSFGFILAEVVRRVDGRRIEQFLSEEIFAPLGLDAYLALPSAELKRTVRLHGIGGNLITPTFVNRRLGRRAVIPAASLHITARSLAAFFRLLAGGGVDQAGRRLCAPQTLAAALAGPTEGCWDHLLGEAQRYGLGFQLGGLPGLVRGIGTRSDPAAFGHNGSSVCNVWADPSRDAVFVYLTGTCPRVMPGVRAMAAMSDAALGAFDAG
ncbi:MAG: beta-lactamase family protein [Bifidobacteriaceae bacterium]|nr:beta-lactamase family protein [Bifidobacteriaceae bacterium]